MLGRKTFDACYPAQQFRTAEELEAHRKEYAGQTSHSCNVCRPTEHFHTKQFPDAHNRDVHPGDDSRAGNATNGGPPTTKTTKEGPPVAGTTTGGTTAAGTNTGGLDNQPSTGKRGPHDRPPTSGSMTKPPVKKPSFGLEASPIPQPQKKCTLSQIRSNTRDRLSRFTSKSKSNLLAVIERLRPGSSHDDDGEFILPPEYPMQHPPSIPSSTVDRALAKGTAVTAPTASDKFAEHGQGRPLVDELKQMLQLLKESRQEAESEHRRRQEEAEAEHRRRQEDAEAEHRRRRLAQQATHSRLQRQADIANRRRLRERDIARLDEDLRGYNTGIRRLQSELNEMRRMQDNAIQTRIRLLTQNAEDLQLLLEEEGGEADAGEHDMDVDGGN